MAKKVTVSRKTIQTTLILAAAVMLVIAVLFSCTEKPSTPTDPEETLQDLLSEFKNRKSVQVTGAIYKNGKEELTVSGTADDESKRLSFDLGGTEYFYLNKFLLKNEADGFIVDSASTSYAEEIKKLTFSAFNFTYDVKRRESISATENLVTVNFYDAGVKDSFSTSLNVSGGVFAINFENGKIKSTVLTTKLIGKDGVSTYSAHYTYTAGEKIAEAPEVSATDTANYARYVIAAIDANYPEQTMRVASNGYDTHSPISVLMSRPENIASSTVITTWEDGTRVLRVNFSTPVDVPLVTYMNFFEITYSPDYRLVGNFRINNTYLTIG